MVNEPTPTALRKSIEIIVIFTPIIIVLLGFILSVLNINSLPNLATIFINFGILAFAPMIVSGFVYALSSVSKKFEFMLLLLAVLLSSLGFMFGVIILGIFGAIIGANSIALVLIALVISFLYVLRIVKPLLKKMSSLERMWLGNIFMIFSFAILLILPYTGVQAGTIRNSFVIAFVALYSIGYLLHYYKRIIRFIETSI